MHKSFFLLAAATVAICASAHARESAAKPQQRRLVIAAMRCAAEPPPRKIPPRKVFAGCPARFEMCGSIHTRGSYVTGLDCRQNPKDLTLLSCLSQIGELYLRADRPQDLRHASALTELNTLYISGNGTVDLAQLSGMKQLQRLHLSAGTRVRSQNTLRQLTQLVDLRFGDDDRVNVQTLSPLVELRELHLPTLTSLAPLDQLDQLRSLVVARAAHLDLAPVAERRCLDTLDLRNASGLKLPAKWPQRLKQLTLQGAALGGLPAGLEELSLKRLDLSHNQLSSVDLTPLTYLANVSLDHNPLGLIDVRLPKFISALSLNHTNTRQLASLQNSRRLRWLSLNGTPLFQLAPLAKLPLHGLEIANSAVKDIRPLFQLVHLRTLNVAGTAIAQQQLTKLKKKNRQLAIRGKTRSQTMSRATAGGSR